MDKIAGTMTIVQKESGKWFLRVTSKRLDWFSYFTLLFSIFTKGEGAIISYQIAEEELIGIAKFINTSIGKDSEDNRCEQQHEK